MARFAYECLKRMASLTKQLETSLGPSTGDLQGRCGLHSGPVTAGVLRGEKARFQLFGDTMNTASRMESSGVPGRIHVSHETAALLSQAGKEHWISARENPVLLKGKGELQTYFVSPRAMTRKIETSRSETCLDQTETMHFDLILPTEISSRSMGGCDKGRIQRLVDWNSEVLHAYLLKVVIARKRVQAMKTSSHDRVSSPIIRGRKAHHSSVSTKLKPVNPVLISRDAQVIDKMTDNLSPSPFMDRLYKAEDRHDETSVPQSVKDQLRNYVGEIASLHRDVPFHNFEHASHVTMSAGKLMKRILHPDGAEESNESQVGKARRIHEKTYGISSDPLLQFAVVFAALVHDVDHVGFTNKELSVCHDPLADTYRGKSVAEQNSVFRAWNLLMEERFADLQQCIYSTRNEQDRFRQLIINIVMATDIADADLQSSRKNRWDLAFHDGDSLNNIESSRTMANDRKAAIVLEHIIQASDVAHCMQHWLTYQKYNRRLFEERYMSWIKLRSPQIEGPSVNWYLSETQFFDNYIIPLAQKLQECGVFGGTYHECLNYAQQNRSEWERKGESIVAEMLADCQKKYGGDAAPTGMF
jgi:3'5'-cyclic nucleotide phosphodiesterase/Adenylate and Guanylate cyclase catalytic domain